MRTLFHRSFSKHQCRLDGCPACQNHRIVIKLGPLPCGGAVVALVDITFCLVLNALLNYCTTLIRMNQADATLFSCLFLAFAANYAALVQGQLLQSHNIAF